MEANRDTETRGGGKQRYRRKGWRQTEIQEREMEADN